MKNYAVKEPEVYEFNLGKKKYSIPLASSMPMKYALRFARIAQMSDEDASVASLELEMELLSDCLGEDVAKNLTAKQVGEIFTDWSIENEKAGVDAGE